MKISTLLGAVLLFSPLLPHARAQGVDSHNASAEWHRAYSLKRALVASSVEVLSEEEQEKKKAEAIAQKFFFKIRSGLERINNQRVYLNVKTPSSDRHFNQEWHLTSFQPHHDLNTNIVLRAGFTTDNTEHVNSDLKFTNGVAHSFTLWNDCKYTAQYRKDSPPILSASSEECTRLRDQAFSYLTTLQQKRLILSLISVSQIAQRLLKAYAYTTPKQKEYCIENDLCGAAGAYAEAFGNSVRRLQAIADEIYTTTDPDLLPRSH